MDTEYRVARPGRRGPTPPRALEAGLLELERRTRDYCKTGNPVFRWKPEGGRYSPRRSLGFCIDAIAASARRPKRAGEQGQWHLSIARDDGKKVTLVLKALVTFESEAPCGTCPLKAWHREIFTVFAPLYSYGIYCCKTFMKDGVEEPSQHSFANAEDVHSPDPLKMKAIAGYSAGYADRLSVHHVIYDHKIWLSETKAWQDLHGGDPHEDHVHVDFLPQLSGRCRVSACRHDVAIPSPASKRLGPPWKPLRNPRR